MQKDTMPAGNEPQGAELQRLFMNYDIICRSVTARDVASAFGLEIDAHGRCSCPFHNGKDKNMKVYEGDRGYYCFVCHTYGNCIKLAQKLLGDGTTYNQAARWIDDKFQLHIFENRTPTFRERQRRVREYTARVRREKNEQIISDNR